MSSDWVIAEIGECCEVLSSKRIFAKDYVKSGVPFYRSKEIIEKALGQFQDNELYITQERFDEINNRFGSPSKGDVLISAVGNRSGIPYFVQEEFDFYFKDGNLIWFRNFTDKLLPKYLVYYLSSPIGQNWINSMMIGSAQKALTITGIKKIEINLPAINEQKATAHILGSLDDKIELNRKMNETLEQMAQALYKSWFVDFDPVLDNAMAKDNSIPDALKQKSDRRKEVISSGKYKALPKEIMDLFPSSFEFNDELEKWIPEGWDVRSFGDLITDTIGGDWGKEYPDEKHTEQVKIIRGTDIPSIKNCDLESAPTRYVELKKLKTRQLEVGDIVIEVSGGSPTQPTGRSILINKNILERLGNIVEPASFCRRFVPISIEISSILNEQLTYIYNQGKMWEYQNQSTGIANFQTKYFLETEKVLKPSKESLIREFHQQVSKLRNKATSNENITLTKQRDVLLPQLISGKLRVNGELSSNYEKLSYE